MDEPIPGLDKKGEELIPLTVIRTETALSRFPVHRIVKKGDVQIEIKNQVSALLWEVTYNSKYGQPGPLAYKIDSLIVNRRIEEAGRPVPEIIRLGSLRDICRELGHSEGGEASLSIKRALQQNASAFINAKISYRTVDRTERYLEASFTRYSVVFTGEKLPDGRSADAVYLMLNRPYVEVLNGALSRPLDYDYMRALPAAAQRFYEIVSYQIYAALHFQNERARLRYSEYCLLSTAIRYPDFDHVKKQMYKIHKPHLESGYLSKVMYEATTDEAGNLDWWMYYVPGPNASREYAEFTGNVRKPGRGTKRATRTPSDNDSLLLPLTDYVLPAMQFGVGAAKIANPPSEETGTGTASSLDGESQLLVEALVAADLNRADAERLALEKPDECRRQLGYLPYVTEFTTSRGAYLRSAIEQGFSAPAAYRKELEAKELKRKRQEEVKAQKAQEAAQEARRKQEEAQLDLDMVQMETEAPEAFLAFSDYVEAERRASESRYAAMPASIADKMRQNFGTPEKRRELYLTWKKTYHTV